MLNKVDKLVEYKSCLGCGLCILKETENAMEYDGNGFLRPSRNAIIDPKFASYCPGLQIVQTAPKKGDKDLIYGPTVVPIVAGWCTDEDIRYKASSGGVITALLVTLMRNNLVDAVLQVRQNPEDPSLTEYHLSTSIQEVIDCMGSRYAPCSLFEKFLSILSIGKRLAVVGKPCDIAALKAYLKIYPEYSDVVKYTFSIMCMGLPSHKATNKLIDFLGVDQNELSSLRYRGYGWPGMATVETRDGKKRKCTYIESWGAILGRDTLFRCKLCPDGFGEFADVSCGDAWYCKDGEPTFENQRGRSFIFIRSNKGLQLVDTATREGFLKKESYDISEMPLIQKSQYQRKINLLPRYIFFKLLVNPKYKLKGFHLMKLGGKAGIKSLIHDTRGFLGRYWRDYKGHIR